MRHVALAILLVALSGCCCAGAREGRLDAVAARQILVVQTTPVPGTDGGPRELLLEAAVLSVGPEAAMPWPADAERSDLQGVIVRRAPGTLKDHAFGRGVEVLAMPSVLTRDDEDATMEVSETSPSATPNVLRMTVTLHGSPEQPTVDLAYTYAKDGRTRARIPSVTLPVEAGRLTFIETRTR